MTIKENIEKVKGEIAAAARGCGRDPEEILLVAVSKTRTPEEIDEAIDAGIEDIGENKVQEILDKYDHVKPVRFHMIGHLQTNKVKYIIDKAALIHSVDSLKLALEIQKQAEKHGRTAEVLVQVNAAEEESKFGVTAGDAEGLIKSILESCENIRLRGLMHIAPFAEDPEDVRIYFRQVKELYDRCARTDHPRLEFTWLSMGMSHDFRVAIEEGANLVRVGTAIFGERNYQK
ncbi:MAG: YggS family pyridoxal phosphate-dependent enzyme [Bacillota bacterium]|nr:YggS family pyridoxal phosphate-dependent enzyme [Bacillota bacterium]